MRSMLTAYRRNLGLLALVGVSYLLLQVASLVGAPAPQAPTAATDRSSASSASLATQRALVTKYYITCHNERLHTAGLLLDKANLEDVSSSLDVWEKVVRKVRMGEMPPSGMPRPDKATMNSFVSWLETAPEQAGIAHPNPGRIPVHRLSRTEYTNAIRDLLGLEIKGRAFLIADDVDQHGFDNIAGSLSVSPALMEQYMSAARKISRLAIGDPTIVPVFETANVTNTLNQDERMNEEL